MLFLVGVLFFAMLVFPIWALGVHFWELDHPERAEGED